MSNKRGLRCRKELEKNNNIEILDTNTNHKNYVSLNNFSIFNKINKFEDEFALENRNANFNLEKRIFNQIKLSNPNLKNDFYRVAYSNRETKTKNFNKENKEFLFKINDFMNDEAALLFKYNNCLNLKQIILRNIDKIKFKIHKNYDNITPNGILDNLDMENILKSEDRYLMTNEHIINNCASVNYKNGSLKKHKLNYNTEEELYSWNKEDKGIIFNQEGVAVEENKNCRNSKNKEHYKKFLSNNSIKLRKNITAVLNKQEDLHKYLESNFCPQISKNFEKEKNRFKKIVVFSANQNKRLIFNKSQNSSVDKNAVNKQENSVHRASLDLEVRNIQDENRIIPRKFKTANNPNKRNTNLMNENKTKQDLISSKQFNEKNGNFITRIKKINRHESQNGNMFFLTNLNKNNQAKEESEFTNKRDIFTPDVNQRSSNLINSESKFFQKFPTRTILKIKSDDNIIKKNKSWNLKNSDVYYKNKKKIKVFERVKDIKTASQNKNLSSNLEFNSTGTKYELTKQDIEKPFLSNDNTKSVFKAKAKNEIYDSKRNSEYSDTNGKEHKENSLIDIIISKTNSNKKMYDNKINKQDFINLLVDTKLNFNVGVNNNQANRVIEDNKHHGELNLNVGVNNNQANRVIADNKHHSVEKKDDVSLKKSEIREDYFDPIEKELNFSRNSSEIKDLEVQGKVVDVKGSSRNLFYYKSKSNFDKDEALILKENLNSNSYYKEKFNENARKHKYSNSKHNSSVPRINANKSASNFFSKNKFFSYSKDEKFRNFQNKFTKENLRFTESFNVRKVKFVFDKKANKAKIAADVLQNKAINKTNILFIKK